MIFKIFINKHLLFVKQCYTFALMKEVTVGIRMDEAMKKKLQLLADKSNRNLSDFIRLELKKLVEKTN